MSDRAVAEFAERVMFMTEGPRKEKQWPFGVWLGLATFTHEAFIGTRGGVVRAWTNEDRRTREVVARRHTGRHRMHATARPVREGAEVHIRIVAERERPEVQGPAVDAPTILRSFYIKRSDAAMHG